MFSEYLCTSTVNKRIAGLMRKGGLTGQTGQGQKEDHGVIEADRDVCKNLQFSCETFQSLSEHPQDSVCPDWENKTPTTYQKSIFISTVRLQGFEFALNTTDSSGIDMHLRKGDKGTGVTFSFFFLFCLF